MNGLEIVTYVIIPGAMVIMVLLYLLFNIERLKLSFDFEIIPTNFIERMKKDIIVFKIYVKKGEECKVEEILKEYKGFLTYHGISYNNIPNFYSFEENIKKSDYNILSFEIEKNLFENFKNKYNLFKINN